MGVVSILSAVIVLIGSFPHHVWGLPVQFRIERGQEECLYDQVKKGEAFTMSAFIFGGDTLKGQVHCEGPVASNKIQSATELEKYEDKFESKTISKDDPDRVQFIFDADFEAEGEPLLKTITAKSDGWHRICVLAKYLSITVEIDFRKESDYGGFGPRGHVFTVEEKAVEEDKKFFVALTLFCSAAVLLVMVSGYRAHVNIAARYGRPNLFFSLRKWILSRLVSKNTGKD